MNLTASIVLHKTSPRQLEKALSCLLDSDVMTVYLIDNSPGTELSAFGTLDPRICYIHVENRGFGAGHNVALREVINDPDGCHLVMNADVWWEGDVPGILTGYLESNPDVGMVMPKVYYPDGDLQLACRMLPTPLDLFAKRFLPRKMTEKRMERYLLAHHDHSYPLNCPYLLGSFLMFRNSALLECGIFDERFFMYPEDIDITRRLHRRWKTMYFPGVSIVHEHAAASRSSGRMLRIHLRNMMKYFCKWGWFFDSERRRFNRRLLKSTVYLPPEKRPPSRG